MAGSASEEAIRADVVAWCHDNLPDARVIHELPVNGSRADVAAVERERLILFEIKSERDTLDRLASQVKDFHRAAHDTIVVAALKWFDTAPYVNGAPRIAWPHGHVSSSHAWAHPKPGPEYGYAQWRIQNFSHPPDTWHMLWLLMRPELLIESARAGMRFRNRVTNPEMVRAMHADMTARQITAAVCRQLRARPVLRGDAPLVEEAPCTPV